MRRLLPIVLILAGILVALATGVAFFGSWNAEMASGFGVTAPGAADLDFGPGEGELAVWRELEGTHVTVNRPLLDQPADLEVEITDRRTGEPIALDDTAQWWVRHQVLPGFSRHRRSVVYFTPPAHGEIRVELRGTFAYEQPYRVGPSIRRWVASSQWLAIAGLIAGAALLLGGLALAVARAVRAEGRAEGRLDAGR